MKKDSRSGSGEGGGGSGRSGSWKPERKTIERNRRIHMKGLCFKLASLIPPHHFVSPPSSKNSPKGTVPSRQDQLDIAAAYIKELKERIEELHRRKKLAMGDHEGEVTRSTGTDDPMVDLTPGESPVIELRELGSGVDLMLVCGLKKKFMLYEVIGALEEEGAEVVSASFCTVGDKVCYSLHGQAKIPRLGVETTRIWQRLHEMIR